MKNSRPLTFFAAVLFLVTTIASPIWVPPLLGAEKDTQVRSPQKTPTPRRTPTPKPTRTPKPTATPKPTRTPKPTPKPTGT